MIRFYKCLLLGLALLICLASAEGIYANPPDATTGFVDVTASPYLANGGDANDDTDEIQAAIDALKYTSTGGNSGGVLYFPKGIYRVGNPDSGASTWAGFSLPAGIIVEGTNSKYNGNCQILLSATAGNNKAIFKIEGLRERIVIRDLTLVGPQLGITTAQTGTVAIRANGTSGQFAFGVRFSNLTIMRFHKGISFEESPATDYNWQYTLVKLEHVNFWECNTNVYINTINTDWEMTSCLFGVYKNGVAIDIVRAGFLSIRDSQGGGGEAVAPEPPGGISAAEAFIWVRGEAGNQHGNITINNVQSEGFRSALIIDMQDYTYPIAVINSGFGDLVQIRANCVFVSVGSTYRANTVRTVPPTNPVNSVYPGATHALIYSQGDNFAAFDNQNRNCATNPAAECPKDFIINNQNAVSGGALHNNALVMRAGESRVDVGRPARFKRPVGVGNVDAPEYGYSGATTTVLLNLATDDSSVIPLRIGGSGLNSSGVENCPSCYYEVRRDMSATDGSVGFMSFEGKQSGYIGFKFNGSMLPFTNGGGDLGSSSKKWNKVWAVVTQIGDAILTDKETGKELYRIYEDERNIYFQDIRTGKEMMRLDSDGNLYVAGRVVQGTRRSTKRKVIRASSRSRRR